MSTLDSASYDSHKQCSIGDSVIAKTQDGSEYRGTVVEAKGATVYIQSQNGKMIEFRRLKDNGSPVILLGIDGKNDVTDHPPKNGANGITQESTTISMDKIVSSFESEEQQHVIE